MVIKLKVRSHQNHDKCSCHYLLLLHPRREEEWRLSPWNKLVIVSTIEEINTIYTATAFCR